jgi:O-antigen ligase
MYIINKFQIDKFNIINLFVALIPLSVIIGNLAININVIIICIFGLIIYGKKIFFLENKKYQYLLNCFFAYLIIITLINYIPFINLDEIYEKNIFKSFFFLRFLIFFLVINKLIEEQDLNIKLFYISSAFLALIVSIDIIIQFIFEKNIFGFPIKMGKASSFFGEEIIAGGYLQKFILFFICVLISKFFNHKNKNIITFILFLIFLFPIFFTGNRMPFIIYFFSCLIFYLSSKSFKSLAIFFFTFFALISLNLKFEIIENTSSKIKNVINEVAIITKHAPRLFVDKNYETNEINFRTGYLVHFNSAVQIWKNDKIFGHGIKSMPLNCKRKTKFQTCNNHPHNYFLEILMDTGVIGLILIYSFFIMNSYNLCKDYFFNYYSKSKVLFFPIFAITFFEFFPFRSSGSFFTTSNSTIIFLMLAFFINYKKIIKIFDSYKI